MKTYAQTVITCVAVGTLSPLTAYRTLPRIVLFPVHSFSIRFRFHKNTSPLPRRRSPAPLSAPSSTQTRPFLPLPSFPARSPLCPPAYSRRPAAGSSLPLPNFPQGAMPPSSSRRTPQLRRSPQHMPGCSLLRRFLRVLPYPSTSFHISAPLPQLLLHNLIRTRRSAALSPAPPSSRRSFSRRRSRLPPFPTAALSGTSGDRAGKRTHPSSIPSDRPEKFLPLCSAPDSGTLFPELFIVFFSQ